MPLNADQLYYRNAYIYRQIKAYKNKCSDSDHMRKSLIKCP